MSISGKRIRLKIGGVVVEGFYRYSARGKVDELDRTTGRDQGYANFDPGVLEKRLTVNLYMDLTDGIVVDVQEGDVVEDVEVFRSDLDATAAHYMAEALVTTVTDSGTVREKLEYEFEIVNKGLYESSTPGHSLR